MDRVASVPPLRGGGLLAQLGLQRLQVFVAVVEFGGFSAAAAQLGLGQPTVTFHVKSLERILGQPLFQQRARRVRLTPEGEAVYRSAAGMLREAEQLVTTLRLTSEGQVGGLQLGASIAFEQAAFFERIIGPFRHAHPQLRLSVRYGHSVSHAEAVLRGELDLAYVLRWRLPDGVFYQPLHQLQFVLMVAAHHPLARREHVSAADIREAGLVTAPLDSAEWPHYEHLLRAAGVAQPRIALEVDGVQARLLAAQAGLGVMGVFVPPYADPKLGTSLRPVHLDSPAPTAECGFVALDPTVWTPAVAAFADWLRRATGDADPRSARAARID